MKHYLINIVYKVPVEEIQKITPVHRAHLHEGYKKGLLLLSGPKIPRTGGLVIARAGSIKQLKEFFSKDSYSKTNSAEYEITEFNPVNHQEILKEWFSK